MSVVQGATVPVRWGLFGIIGGLLVCLTAPAVKIVHAQKTQWRAERVLSYKHLHPRWWDCGLRKMNVDAFVSQRPGPSKRRKASASILVDYSANFPVKAQAAFHRAVRIWEAHISTPVTIRIDARFDELAPGVLAGAGPTLVVTDTSGDGQGDLILGSPLLDARTGSDQLPRQPDMHVSFNERDDWHYGAAPAPEKTIDFTTVALHEIGHGLNYVGLFRTSGPYGTYGADFDRNGRIDRDERLAGVFGEQLIRAQPGKPGLSLTDTQVFDNPSRALGKALLSDSLFFTGRKSKQEAKESNGPTLPKIYSPMDFEEGSSISHLDESTYLPKTKNALMTPRLKRAETIRLPGPIMCAQLIDMGWEPGPGCALGDLVLASPRGTVRGKQIEQRKRIQLTWELRGESSTEEPGDEFVIEQQQFVASGTPEPFVRRTTVPVEGAGKYSVVLDNVRVGTHAFRISTDNGISPPITTTVSVEAEQPDVSVYPNPFEETAFISFVLPEAQKVTVEVFDVLGRQIATPFEGERPANTARPVTFDADQISASTSGTYFFRITGETFTQVEKAVLVR